MKFPRARLLVLPLLISSLAFADIAFAEDVGWRGDGSGIYPGAHPPTTWSRATQSVLGRLRCAAQIPPKNASGGDPVAPQTGLMNHWLVLGPLPAGDDPAKALAATPIREDGNLNPKAGDKAGELAWQTLDTLTTEVNLKQLIGSTGENQICYATTCLYADEPGKIRFWTGAHDRGLKVWVNGAPIFEAANWGDGNTRAPHLAELQKGWNRVVCKVSQGQRNWSFNVWLAPAHPVPYASQNIAWITRLPAESPSSPIVLGDRIFVTSNPDELLCIDKRNGKVVWMRATNLFDAATPEEQSEAKAAVAPLVATIDSLGEQYIAAANAAISRTGPTTGQSVIATDTQKNRFDAQAALATAMRNVDRRKYRQLQKQDFGVASPTPVTDGKFVYANYTSGTTVCYDLDGRRKWIAFENHGNEEHGNHYSPVLCGKNVIVSMNHDIRALDRATGALAWRAEMKSATCNSPIVTKVDGEELIVTGEGTFIRGRDGVVLGHAENWGGCASPIVSGDTVYCMGHDVFNAAKLPASLDAPQAPKKVFSIRVYDHDLEAEFKTPTTFAGGFVASPLAHDGLIYLVAEGGFLLVLDAATGESVYREKLPLHPRLEYISQPGCAASPALAGGHIYIFDNSGTAVVVEPGRTYKLLATNVIEDVRNPGEWNEMQEQLMASPAFDRDSIYLRGQENLYCLRETTAKRGR